MDRVEITQEVRDLVEKLKSQWGIVRHLSPEFVKNALANAYEYRGCHLAFWRTENNTRYLFIYRIDRGPNDEEIIPWMQELFLDGQIHQVTSMFCRALFQGEVYNVENALSMLANSLADASEKDSDADAFDFSKTKLGKRLSRHANGTR